MTVEIVTFGVRNFPLICIGCGSNRLKDKEKIFKYNNIKVVKDHKLFNAYQSGGTREHQGHVLGKKSKTVSLKNYMYLVLSL